MQWKEDDTKTIVTREAGTPTPGGHCQTQRAEGSQGPNYREGVLPNYVKIEKQAGTELRVTETQDCDKGGGIKIPQPNFNNIQKWPLRPQ